MVRKACLELLSCPDVPHEGLELGAPADVDVHDLDFDGELAAGTVDGDHLEGSLEQVWHVLDDCSVETAQVERPMLLGDDEIAAGEYSLKDMQSGEQRRVKREELAQATR